MRIKLSRSDYIIRVLSVGTKFIPKWKKENTKDTFRNFEHFRKKLNKTVYFKEISPGFFERDKNFKLKSSYNAIKENDAVNEFCFRIRDRISNLMVISEKDKVFKNISNQEKKELNSLIKNKVFLCALTIRIKTWVHVMLTK